MFRVYVAYWPADGSMCRDFCSRPLSSREDAWGFVRRVRARAAAAGIELMGIEVWRDRTRVWFDGEV